MLMAATGETMSTDRQTGPASLFTHYLRYLGANGLAVIAGFVSFPIMARLLDNHQFGVLGYYEAWLLLIVGMLKLGAQHAIVRHYPHGRPEALRAFRSDFVLMPYGLSLLLWIAAAVLLITVVLPALPETERTIAIIMLLTAPLLIWSSLVESVMYALERSDIALRLKPIWRWGELGVVLATLAWIERSAAGVFGARLLVVVVVALWLTAWLRRWLVAPMARPRRTQVLTGLAFGLPMMFNELAMVLFAFADRILLRVLTGEFSQVGIYTIGYGLAMALGTLLGMTLDQAFTPTAIRHYETDGADAVVGLKKRMLDAWLAVVAIATVWLACAGHDLLVLLAGPDKAQSGPVFVAIAITLVWNSLFGIAHYGLLLERRAMRYFLITLGVTLLNLALNVPLILAYGVAGAVTATVVSYAVMAVSHYHNCPSRLRYLPPKRALLGAAVLALLVRTGFEAAAQALSLELAGRVALATATTAILAVLIAALTPGLRRMLSVWFNAHLSRGAVSGGN